MDEKKWINSFFGINRNDNIESIKNFALLWNIFERYFCSMNASLNIIKNKIYKLDEIGYNFPKKIHEDYYDYFRNRYVNQNDNSVNELFENLNFRDNRTDIEYKALLKEILENPNSVIKNKLLANFIIIYRLRNNLFHGSKNIATISEQNVSFEIANKIIMDFLEFLKNSGILRK